jgi:hypothetical protein
MDKNHDDCYVEITRDCHVYIVQQKSQLQISQFLSRTIPFGYNGYC